MAAHAVGHDEKVSLFMGGLHLRLREAGLLNLQLLRQHGNEELVLIRGADLPTVG